MILSGIEILKKINHTIFIDPFDEKQINPNSYNLKLHHELLVYDEAVLDMRKENKVKKIIIPKEGYVLQPGELYLGRTVERTKAIGYVPMLEGRSSIARLGIMVHLTAGLGNVGSEGYWTLEISCVRPVKIYPEIAICQIYFQELRGEFKNYNGNGKYHNQDIQPSLIHRELN
jgi:dCTP deaminase